MYLNNNYKIQTQTIQLQSSPVLKYIYFELKYAQIHLPTIF